MAVLSHPDFLPLADEVLAHWALADAAAGPGGVVLAGGLDRPGFSALRGALAVKRTEMEHHRNTMELGAARLAELRGVVLERVVQFNDTVRAWWGRTPLGAVLPRAPEVSAGLERYLRPVRDALRLWARLNAGPAPSGVVLPLRLGAALDFPRAGLEGLVAQMLAARDEAEAGEFDLGVARAERDALEAELWAGMVGYARAVVGRLGAGSTHGQTLPRLTPLRGHTPDRLTVTAVWDAARGEARLEWEATEEATAVRYEVRWFAGPRYVGQKARRALAVPVSEFTGKVWTLAGLPAPGAVVWYKVYVVLETGNERGSKPVRVARDGGLEG